MITLDTVIQQLHIWDGQILLFIQEHLRMEALNPIVIAITNLGNTGIVWIVLSIVLLFPKKTRRAGLLSLLALLGSLCVTNFLLKNYVARVRPYEVVAGLQCLIAAQPDWSFPSGHASASFASAVVIYKSCPRGIGVPALVLAFAISLSRLYVGVHYPTDVLGGAVVGAFAAWGAVRIVKRREMKGRREG